MAEYFPMKVKEIPTTLSHEEAKFVLTFRQDVPAAVRNVFGSQHIKELVDMLLDPELVDVDMLFLTGQLTRDEFMQYQKRLPEILATKEKISGIVQEIANELQQKMPQLIAATQKRDRKNDLTHLISSLVKIKDILKVKNHTSLRNVLVQDFYEKTMTMFYALVSDYFQGKSQQARERYLVMFGNLMDNISKRGKHGFSCTVFIQERELYRNTLEDPVYFDRLNQLTGAVVQNKEEREKMKEELDGDLIRIEELAQMRKIYYTTFDYGSAGKISIMGDDLVREGEFHTQLCNVHVFLHPDKQPVPPESNDGAIQFTWSDGEISFHVNRGSGELSFISNQGTSLSTIMHPDQYLYLRKTVFECLLAYLQGKEEDINDLFTNNNEPQNKICEEVRQEVKCTITNQPADEVKHNPVEIDHSKTTKYKPYEKPVGNEMNSSGTHELEVESDRQDDKTQHRKKSEYVRRLRNVSGVKILAAVKSLLGDPIVRVQGSHHIMSSNRTGKTYPIPIHGSRTVNFGIILDCLKMWGIDLEELCKKI